VTERAAAFPCSQLVELVTDYLEGTLAPDLRQVMDEHLEICEGCTTYLEQLRVAVKLTGRLREDDLSPELEAELMRAFRDWSARGPGGDPGDP
jgi:anti-sigma factor RsiW